MKKPSILKTVIFNTLIILLLVVVGIFATVYGATIKYQVLSLVANRQAAKVLGAKVLNNGPVPDANKKASEMGEAVQSGIHQQVDSVKEKALNTKVSDVIDLGAKIRKIATDISNMKANILEKVQELSKKKDDASQ